MILNKMRKKSEIDYFAGVIIMLIILAVFLSLMSYLRKGVEESREDIECRASAEANANLHFLASDFSANINCPAKEILMTENLNEQQGQDNAKRKLANSMHKCWKNFLEGRKQLFGEEKTYCAVCSIINFEQKDKAITGFSGFLSSEKVPGQKATYSQYLFSQTPEAEKYVKENLAAKTSADSISTINEYSVVFVYAKGEENVKKAVNYLGGTAPVVAGTGIIGAVGGGAIALYAAGAVASGGTLVLVTVVGGIVGGVLSGGSLYDYLLEHPPLWMSTVLLTRYSSDELKNIGCEELPVEQENK